MKPEFSSYNDWKQLGVKAGFKEEINDMPLDVYLKAAKDLWPHLESKMGKWMEQAEQRDPTKVDRGEFQQFRDYIHKVGDSGCVVDYKTFISYNSKTEGTPTNYKDQFNKNSGCKAHTSETQCASPCVWQGEKPAETEFDCAKATAVASCPTDKCMWDPTKAVKCNKKHTTNPTQPLPSCPSFEGPKLNECPLDRCVKVGTGCVPKPTTPVVECHKATVAAACPVNVCLWEATTNKCIANPNKPTDPTKPTDHCAAITAVADCTGKKGCKFDKNVCQRMDDDEQMDF
jgi:hypothetical protein